MIGSTCSKVTTTFKWRQMYASGEGTRTTIHNIDLKWNKLAMKLMSGTWLSRRVRAGKPREIDTLATMTKPMRRDSRGRLFLRKLLGSQFMSACHIMTFRCCLHRTTMTLSRIEVMLYWLGPCHILCEYEIT